MTADTVGGVWTYALELVRALQPHGIDVALATMGSLPTEEQLEEASEVANLELFSSNYRLEWMDDPWPDVTAAGDWLLELERQVQPDVVHLNGYAHGALPWDVPTCVIAHSCVLSWWEAVHGVNAPDKEWARYSAAVRRGLQAADVVVAPTAAMLSATERHYGPLGASTVIPNGRDLGGINSERKRECILCAGRIWDEAKNIRALAEVAPELPWPVYVAGEQRQAGVASAFEFSAKAGRQMQSLGKLNPQALTKWFSIAAIYALPAKYEPFGLSALEAALCGCALVLGDIPSLREVWGDAAIYVPPSNTEILKSELLHLLRDEEHRLEMSTKAHRVAQQYTPARMAASYVELYELLLNRGTSKPAKLEAVA